MDTLAIEVLVGYFTTPLVSLAIRKKWPQELKMLVALVVGSAAATIAWLAKDGETFVGWSRTFFTVFGAQQVTWGLKVPGAGTESINERLIEVGSDGHDPEVEG